MASDDELLAEILAEVDLDRLVALIYPKLKAYFLKRVSSVDVCLDLTQEAVLKVCRNIERLRGPEKFWGWLFRIASNLLYDYRRQRIPVVEEPTDDVLAFAETLQSTDPSPEKHLMRAERRRALQGAIAALPPQMRRCTILRIGHGLRYREIAEVMNLSEGAVKAHLAQARKRLEAAIKKLFEEEEP